MSEVKRYRVDAIRLGNPTTARTHTMVHAEVFDAAQAELAALREELAALQELSVTNILLDVVPGHDGMGHEVFAKSVAEVCEKLGDFAIQVEDLDSVTSRLHDVATLCATTEQRLTAAEQRNAIMTECLERLRGCSQLRPTPSLIELIDSALETRDAKD